MHEALQPIWLWLTIIAVGALLFALFKWRGEVGAFAKKFARKEKKPDAHGHDKHDDHHKKDDHGGGGHHHGDNFLMWSVKMIGLAVLIGGTFIVVRGCDVEPGAAPEVRREIAERTGALGPIGASATDWRDLPMPPRGREWSEAIEIPYGYFIRFCDPERDPMCSAADFTDSRFTPQCRSAKGEWLDWGSGNCNNSTANRVQAKGDEPLTIKYRFERRR